MEILLAVLGSSDAGMVSKTLHFPGFSLIVSAGSSAFSQIPQIGVLPSRHIITIFKYLKGHHVEQIVLSSTASEVRIRTRRLIFYMKADLYLI